MKASEIKGPLQPGTRVYNCLAYVPLVYIVLCEKDGMVYFDSWDNYTCEREFVNEWDVRGH
jgi:hypothetical protein